MKTASGLTLIALGAVLAFAVNGHPWFLNLQICGWILIIIGAIGLVMPRRGYGWLRRQVVVRRGPGGQQAAGIQPERDPRYIMISPAAAGVAGAAGDVSPGMPEMPASSDAASRAEAGATAVPDQETVEEFFQD
jgi:hypothetical protein